MGDEGSSFCVYVHVKEMNKSRYPILTDVIYNHSSALRFNFRYHTRLVPLFSFFLAPYNYMMILTMVQ